MKDFWINFLLAAPLLRRSHMTNHTHSQSEEEIETIRLVIQDQSVTSLEISKTIAKDNVLQSVIHLISENWFIRDSPNGRSSSGASKNNYHYIMASSTEVIAL